MTKNQKSLIIDLLSNAYCIEKENLQNLIKRDNNQVAEFHYNKKLKLIEETFKEIESYDTMES